MTQNEGSKTLVQLAEEAEEDIAHLYQTYSEKFPQFTKFWSGLVVEQIRHANMIHGLMNKTEGGLLYCREDRYDCKVLHNLHIRVHQEIARAKEGQISAGAAFFIALEIEKAISKREYSEALDEGSREVRDTFSYLATSTQRHIEWIEEHIKPEE